MTRLTLMVLMIVLLPACSGIRPPSLPVPTQPPGGNESTPPVILGPIATPSEGSGVLNPPSETTIPGPGGSNQPYAPQPGDSGLQRGTVFLDSVQLMGLMTDLV